MQSVPQSCIASHWWLTGPSLQISFQAAEHHCEDPRLWGQTVMIRILTFQLWQQCALGSSTHAPSVELFYNGLEMCFHSVAVRNNHHDLSTISRLVSVSTVTNIRYLFLVISQAQVSLSSPQLFIKSSSHSNSSLTLTRTRQSAGNIPLEYVMFAAQFLREWTFLLRAYRELCNIFSGLQMSVWYSEFIHLISTDGE